MAKKKRFIVQKVVLDKHHPQFPNHEGYAVDDRKLCVTREAIYDKKKAAQEVCDRLNETRMPL